MSAINKESRRHLTEKQELLVDTLVAKGCSIAEASQDAGYAKGESGRVSASKALRLWESMLRWLVQSL